MNHAEETLSDHGIHPDCVRVVRLDGISIDKASCLSPTAPTLIEFGRNACNDFDALARWIHYLLGLRRGFELEPHPGGAWVMIVVPTRHKTAPIAPDSPESDGEPPYSFP